MNPKNNCIKNDLIANLTEREYFVYELLQDDGESKDVYLARQAINAQSFGLDFVVDLIEKCVSKDERTGFFSCWVDNEPYYHTICQLLDKMRNNKFIIYGWSQAYRPLIEFFLRTDTKISDNLVAVWDRDPDLNGMQVTKDVRCEITPNSYLELKFDHVILTSPAYTTSMLEQLDVLSIPRSKVVTFSVWAERKQYFDPEIITPHLSDQEIFIDCGCLDFATSNRLLALNPNVKKIYAFEPDINNYQECLINITDSGFGNVVHKNAAWWSSDTTLQFSTKNGGGSNVNNSGTGFTIACAIDTIVPESEIVTFIKMDIEGAELEALKGAASTITRCRPKLAICIYHKNKDHYEIAEYIHSLVPEYKMYVRHYTTCNTETVLYCIT